MRILQLNKYYFIKGGCETYYFSLKRLLENKKHQIVDFSMKDDRNYESEYQSYFIDNIDYDKKMSFWEKMQLTGKIIYSLEAKRKIQRLIEAERPDIAHLHNFHHQISPSILGVLKKNKIPIVYTAHDLKIVCPNYKMLSQNLICEKCKGHKYYQCFLNRCVKNSRLKSSVNMVEMYLHHLKKSYDFIDVIITPSNFYREKLIDFGVTPEKIVFIPNFLEIEEFAPAKSYKDYFILLGRLSEEKGIMTLLEAMMGIHRGKLIIIGNGPMEPAINKYISEQGLQNKVFLVGYQKGEELRKLIRESMFSVIPSEWYENGPYSVLEMMAYAKPVIGSKIGGIPEIIEDQKTGLIFEKGNPKDLADKINFLLNHPDLIIEYGRCAREKIEKKYNAEKHYQEIDRVYQRVMN